nr:MAG TPA: hypothetical protein [Caudoviricetes sp.]
MHQLAILKDCLIFCFPSEKEAPETINQYKAAVRRPFLFLATALAQSEVRVCIAWTN